MEKYNFPFYTMEGDDLFVKHITKGKCIKVAANATRPYIRVEDYFELTTNEFDRFEDGNAQPIPKQRFDIERQQVISQLISG